MSGEDVERRELTSRGMEKMKWGFEGVEPLWGTLLLAPYFADWLNIQFKTWYFQLSSVKICKPFKARTVSLYGTWRDGTPVPDASKCMCIVCFVLFPIFLSPSTCMMILWKWCSNTYSGIWLPKWFLFAWIQTCNEFAAFKNAEAAWFWLFTFFLSEINGAVHPAFHVLLNVAVNHQKRNF